MKPSLTVVFGASGHGKVVADILLSAGCPIDGFVDDDKKLHRTTVLGLPVFGGEAWLKEKIESTLVVVALGIGNQLARKSAAERSLALGAELAGAIHPRATVAKSAKVGQGTVVMAGAVINADALIGSGVIINTGAVIEHDVIIGDYAHISPNAATGGNVHIGSLSHVGMGAVILPGITVGRETVIGAGAVVVNDLPDGVVAMGVPAKIRSRMRAQNS